MRYRSRSIPILLLATAAAAVSPSTASAAKPVCRVWADAPQYRDHGKWDYGFLVSGRFRCRKPMRLKWSIGPLSNDLPSLGGYSLGTFTIFHPNMTYVVGPFMAGCDRSTHAGPGTLWNTLQLLDRSRHVIAEAESKRVRAAGC